MPDSQARGGTLAQEPDIVGTILVLLHDHARFIAACLAGVAAAWRPGLEILLIDDASRDDGLAVAVRCLADHAHIPVMVMRTAEVLGHGKVEAVLALARGRFVIQCDSDDVPMPDRFAEIMDCFAADPGCRLVTSNAMTITEDGTPIGLFDTHWPDETMADPGFAAGQAYDRRWLGATAAYHRHAFEAFPLDGELCPYGLDLVTPLRALLLGRHRYLVKPLVAYRLHAGNAHRAAGAYGRTHAERARYGALTMMALAQKLRDLASPAAGAVPAPLVDAARRVFFDSFDAWSRSATRAGREPEPMPPPAFLPAIPPIATLRPGETLSLGGASPFAAVAARWSGIHPAEDWGCWCGRAALLALRLPPSGRGRLLLSLHTSQYAEAHPVSVRIGAEPWVRLALAPLTDCEIGLELPDGGACILPLVIVSHVASVPRDVDASNPDGRLIGVGLRHITLAAR